jgi:hypothetical protein
MTLLVEGVVVLTVEPDALVNFVQFVPLSIEYSIYDKPEFEPM